MIQSFADKKTKQLFSGKAIKSFTSFRRQAERKLQILDSATALNDLRAPPGNRLEALKGDRKGQYSIRINDQWRLCFKWTDKGPEDVEIADYH